MDQQNIFEPVPCHKLESLSKGELIRYIDLQQQANRQIQKYIKNLEKSLEEDRQYSLFLNEEYILLRDKLFGKSSEKEGSGNDSKEKNQNSNRPKKIKVQLPSQRYPNVPVQEQEIDFKEAPQCSCCGEKLKDSGLTEDSEHLTVIPAKYLIIRQKRHKYSCSKCYGDIQTAPCEPRIKPGSSFSDDMIIDVSMSKYCDLIPIERYAVMAGRQGLQGLPPQSLIELTHYMADFVREAYVQLKDTVMTSQVTHADETPHRMLEGDVKSHWHLWGFSSSKASYFDIRNTRSGEVASNLLKTAKCQFLMSDVFSGYTKAVFEANEYRKRNDLPLLENIHCNAHARRYFKDAAMFEKEAQYFIDQYKKITD
jgi:transposase